MSNEEIHVVGGLYEVCIGVTSIVESVRYFERQGYRIGPTGHLDVTRSEALYGVSSAANVARLLHGQEDHGLIRLIEWEKPANEGLKQTSMRAVGSRWSNNQTLQMGRIHGHAFMAQSQGENIYVCPPAFAQFGHEDAVIKPFEEEMTGVYEMSVHTNLYRQCYFERVDYPSPLYGKVDESCLFQTSQVTHCGITTSITDRAVFDFYDKCLGLKRVLDVDVPYEHMQASRTIFDIPEGLGVHALGFDDNRSGPGELKRSGRLLIFNFDKDSSIENLHEKSRAGVLGYSHFSWRVANIEQFKRDALTYGAKSVGGIERDEFGHPAWCCIAPDGYYWLFIQEKP